MPPKTDRGAFSTGSLVKVAVLAVVLVGTGLVAAQLGVVPALTGDDVDPVSQVPDGVDSVSRVDPAALEDDGLNRLYEHTRAEALQRIRERANATDDGAPAAERPDYDSLVPATLGGVGDEFENGTGLDPADADEIVVYQRARRNLTAQQYSAMVVHADWNATDVVAYARNQSGEELENTTVNGTTVYRPAGDSDDEEAFGPTTEQWLAVLDDGEFVLGTEPAVRDAIAVHDGNHDPLDGPLAEALGDTRDGYVQFAQRQTNVNTSLLESSNPNTAFNLSQYAGAYNSVHDPSGAYYTTDSGVGAVTTVRTNSTSTAEDLESIYSGMTALAAGLVQNDTVQSELRSVEVEREDQQVTVTQETSYEAAEAILEWYVSLAISTEPPTYDDPEPVA